MGGYFRICFGGHVIEGSYGALKSCGEPREPGNVLINILRDRLLRLISQTWLRYWIPNNFLCEPGASARNILDSLFLGSPPDCLISSYRRAGTDKIILCPRKSEFSRRGAGEGGSAVWAHACGLRVQGTSCSRILTAVPTEIGSSRHFVQRE